MDGPRRTGTWVGAGIFAALAVCILVILFKLFTGVSNLPAGREMPVNPPPQHVNLGQVAVIIGFAVVGAFLGMVHNLDASAPGRVLAIARGTFLGSLLLLVGLICLVFLALT